MNFFISNSRLVILISLVFIFMGAKGLLNLQRESIPPVDFARAIITTIYPGSSPAEVEELITSKIEKEIKGIDHLKDVNSLSKEGLSLITIRMDIDNADTKEVINELRQALQNVKGLPAEVLDPPKLIHIESHNEKPILNLMLTGSNKERKRDKKSWKLKSQLEKIPGVSIIKLKNYKKKEFLVLLSNAEMEKHHISSADVITTLQQKNRDVPAGWLESKTQRKQVRIPGKSRNVQDLENTIIRSNFSGQKVFIKDVAQVIDGSEKEKEKRYFYSAKSTEGYKLQTATSLQLMKTAKADIVTLVSKIQKKIKDWSQNLNKNYQIQISFNEAKNTKRRLFIVISNALSGLLIIVIVFFLFLPTRIGFMVSWSLPLSLLGTFACLSFFDVSFNVITMLAFVICIGMLVDNSVVLGEHYSRLVTDAKKDPQIAAKESVHQFLKPITATVLTTIVAFLPLLVTKGVMGEFVKWIPIVITMALLMSLFESFCLLPNRLQWITQKKPSSYQKGILNKLSQLENLFERALKKIVTKKYLSLSLIAFLIFATALLFVYASRVNLFSQKSPEFYTAFLEPHPNSSLESLDEKAKQIAHKMYSVFEKEKSIQWMTVQSNLEQASILLRVKPSMLRKLNYKNLLAELRKTNKGNLKNLNFRALVGGPPIGKALNIAVQSHTRKDIRKFIEGVLPKIKKIPGLVNLKSNPETDRGLEYKVQIRPETLSRLGLNFQSVGLSLRTALEGYLITELTENNESFYIRVKHNEKEINSIESLKKIKIKEMFGRLISLNEVADIKEVPSEPHRKSYNFEPVVFLESDIDPKKTTSLKVNSKAKQILEKEITNYPSVSFKLIGEQETTQESLQSLFNAASLAIFAIFIILIILFKSFLISFLILTCIPLGLIGVIWSFFIHQRDLNFFAMIGVVGLAGVVVNSAIILISFILKLKKEEPKTSVSQIVVKASKIRFRPILITNLTTLGGLLPTAYGIAGYEPLLMPMTLALFWGLLTATFLTLIWIPCAMLMIEDGKKLFSSFKKKIRF